MFRLTLGHLQRLLSQNNRKTTMVHSYTGFFVKVFIKSIIHSQLLCCFHQSGRVSPLGSRYVVSALIGLTVSDYCGWKSVIPKASIALPANW
jgi:hypothetical protein